MNFDEINNRKGTHSIKWEAGTDKGISTDTLPMWVADMDFKTADKVIETMVQRAAEGIYGYTLLADSYYQSIIGWMLRRHDWKVAKEWIVSTPGVVNAINTAVQAYTSVGDGILINRPVYYPFSMAILNNDRKIVNSSLVYDKETSSYSLDLADFEAKIVANNVKMFILCNPHNPVGRVWRVDELKAMADLCLKHNVIIISDEIHMDFVFKPAKHRVLTTLDARYASITVVCTSPSKTFNLAGLQASNIIIENEELRTKFNLIMRNNGIHATGFFGSAACEAAYLYGDSYVDELMDYLKGNIDYVRSFLNEHLSSIKLVEPEGLYLIWLDFNSLGLDNKQLEDFMLNQAKLWLDEGYIFGEEGNGFERINIACPRSVVIEAMERLKCAVESLNRK